MEYLMTYGWAILVVIIVGVVLWQMGIFNPSGGTAPGSKGFGSVRAKDWSCSAASGNVQVQWVNGAGEKITLTATTFPNGGCVDAAGAAVAAGANVSANAIVTCTYNALTGCSGLTAGDRFESLATLSWKPAAGGIEHTESGTVWKASEA
jgi:hypothetical protein